jgi:histidine triad (HIT) family protein
MTPADDVSECLFCRIASGEIPAEIVHSTESVVAFRDLAPQAPVHVLVIPREHHENAAALAQSAPQTAVDLVNAAAVVADLEGLAGQYRLVFNTGSEAGQSVYHTHLHLLGGRPMGWPPG